MSMTPPRANIRDRTIPYAVPTTSGGTAAVTREQKNSPSSTKMSTMEMGSMTDMSAFAPCRVSYAMGTEPVTYVLISDSPASSIAEATTDLRFPTSSMDESPPPTENDTRNTPESPFPYEPRTVNPTESPYLSPTASERTPESIRPESILESSPSSSYGIARTVSVVRLPPKCSSTIAWPSDDSESKPPMEVMS